MYVNNVLNQNVYFFKLHDFKNKENYVGNKYKPIISSKHPNFKHC